MKMNNKVYLFAAALVAGTMGMTSCSNEVVPETEINPTFDGESVKTQFAINIPAGQSTRMSADNTQQNSNFLGMQNIKLLPMKETPADNKGLLQIISLADIATSGLDNNCKFYSDVNIPVGTTNFLFYAEATGTKSADNIDMGQDAFAQGFLANTLSEPTTNNTDAITFSLVPITSKNNFVDATTETDGSAKAIIDALTKVAGAASADGSKWKDYADSKTEGTDAFADMYKKLVTLKAGSANSVKLVLEDLKAELAKLPSNEAYNSILGNETSGVKKAVADALTSLASNTFPQDYNLPDGAVRLTWDEGVPTYDGGGYVMGDMTLKPENICYPASLSYFVNTPLKATSDVNPIWPTDLSNWTSWTTTGGNWTNGPVDATTTAIGLTKAIQYAVANLKTTVKCKTAVLEDNAQAYAKEPTNRKVMVPTNGFTVTGVLVGGQPSSVAWDFVPSSDEADQRAMMVYDKNMNETVAATATNATGENYTLVLDNRKTGAGNTTLEKADKVYIALELKNTSGADFYGKDGLVKADATFYLVAELDPTKVSTEDAKDRTSVFEQDYTTVANLTISSLKNAYNCIPDLRSTQLSLGLAVDLTWQSGITFDVAID